MNDRLIRAQILLLILAFLTPAGANAAELHGAHFAKTLMMKEETKMSHHKDVNDTYNDAMYEFLNENFEKCIEILSEIAALDPGRKLTFVSRGSAYLRLNQLDKALHDFNHAIDIDADYARAFHLKGLVEEKQGDDARALQDFSRAIEIDPEYGAAYHSRATLHSKMGHEDLALDDIAMVHHLTNKNIETYANDNNIWRSQHLRLEANMESELGR